MLKVMWMDILRRCKHLLILAVHRKLCRKLPLNAESQQIDRILENFAIRYWECNPKSPFGNAGKRITAKPTMGWLNN
jgi:hypothetical protein